MPRIGNGRYAQCAAYESLGRYRNRKKQGDEEKPNITISDLSRGKHRQWLLLNGAVKTPLNAYELVYAIHISV